MAFPSSDDITVPSTDEELKAACRLGLHPALRRSLWRRLVKAEPRADFYSAACVRVFGSAQPKPSRLFRVPFLGNTPWAAPPDIVPLLSQPSVSTSSAHDRIVCVLAQLYGLVHCPMAANLALLLLAHASEAESFAVLESLLSPAAGERRLFQTPSDDAAFARAFMEVTRERHPQLIRHLETCGRDAALRMFESWFRTLFYGWLPFADVLYIVDVFLSEGPKALIRLGMAWLRARKRALKRCSTIDEVEASLRGWVAGAAEPDDAFAYTYPAMAEHGFALRRLGRDVIAGYMTQALRRAGGSGGGGISGGGIGGGGSGGSVAGLIAGAVSGSIRRGISGSAAAADDDDDDDDDGGMVLLSRGGDSGSSGAAATRGGLARANSSPAVESAGPSASAAGAAAAAAASTTAAAAADAGRWYNPLVVGRPPALLPLRPLPRDLATEAEHLAAQREALATVAGHKAAAALDAGGDPAAILASLPADAAAAVAAAVARRLTLPPSVLAQPPSFSTASSPSLAALVALLPPRSRSSDWRCLYTTAAHGWTRAELLRHTSGIAPLLLVMRMALPPGKARASTAPGAGASPVFGVFLNDGLALPSPASAAQGAARWQGHPTDFLFQLQPHVTLFPAHPPSAVAARAHSVPPAGAHEHGLAASAAPAAAGAGAPAHRHAPRLHLSSDRMTLSTSDFTAFGGARSSTAVALRLPDTFSRCTASAELLFELGLISARDLHDAAFGVEPEVELHGLEAFGLVDGSASVSFSRSAAGRLGPASLARVDAAEKKERAEAAELAEQQAHAFGGEAAVADLKARVSRLVGDERGAAEANRVAAEFEARQRDAAARATAFRG